MFANDFSLFLKVNNISGLMLHRKKDSSCIRHAGISCITVFLFCLLCIELCAQQYSFRVYSPEDGLAQSQVNCIMQDRKGYLWFGTSEGISKFEDTGFLSFKTENRLTNSVYTIFEDKKNILWFGTGAGVRTFDGKKWEESALTDPIKTVRINAIAEDSSSRLWFGTATSGVFYKKPDKWVNLKREEGLISNNITSMLTDKSNNLWIGTDGGVSKFDGKDFSGFTTHEGLLSNNVRAMVQDSAGDIWFATNSGISRFNGEKWFKYEIGDLFDTDIFSVYMDKAERLWFGTIRGLVLYDGFDFLFYRSEEGVKGMTFSTIAEDGKGDLWFGTQTEGLNRAGK